MLGSRQSRDWFFNCYFWLVLYATFIFFIFTISVFIFWLIFLPQELKFTITNASLMKFSLTKTNTSISTLHCELALNISIRNPNKKVGVYYGHFQAIANYGGKSFAQVNNISTPFYQGHLSNTTIHVALEGQQQLVVLEEFSRFKWETHDGVYIIDVKLALRIKARYGKIKTGYLNSSEVDCQLKLPLRTSNIMFNVTDCESTVALPLLWP